MFNEAQYGSGAQPLVKIRVSIVPPSRPSFLPLPSFPFPRDRPTA